MPPIQAALRSVAAVKKKGPRHAESQILGSKSPDDGWVPGPVLVWLLANSKFQVGMKLNAFLHVHSEQSYAHPPFTSPAPAPFLLLSITPYTTQRHTHQDEVICSWRLCKKHGFFKLRTLPCYYFLLPVSHTLFDIEKIVALYAPLPNIFISLATLQTFKLLLSLYDLASLVILNHPRTHIVEDVDQCSVGFHLRNLLCALDTRPFIMVHRARWHTYGFGRRR